MLAGRCLGLLCLVAFAGCAGSLARYERSLIYQPAGPEAGDWSSRARASFEDAHFAAADGTKLHGWFIDTPEPRAVALFTHGNGGNVALWAPSIRLLAERHRLAALVFDYRGYGNSAGKPSETGILQDARAARSWLANRTGTADKEVLLIGQSLGGGVAVDLAARDGARGLVLMSTFTSVPAVAAHHMPWLPTSLLMTQQFQSLRKITDYDGPLLICHGDADRVIPFSHGEKLFAAAPTSQKWFVRHAGGDHNDPPPEEFHQALDAFLEALPK